MNIGFLRSLKNLPSDAVFAIVSDSANECYIGHTTNLRINLGRVLDEIELRDDSRLEVYFTGVQDIKYKLMYAQYQLALFNNLGYKILGDRRSYINYKVGVQFSQHLDRALVVLENKRRDRDVVGVFKSLDEANQFICEYYPKGGMIQPVYAINGETKEWYINSRRTSKSKN